LSLAADRDEQPGDAHGRDRDRLANSPHLAAAGVERGDGRGHDGAAAAGRRDRGDAAVVRERPDRDREVTRIAAHRGGAALWPENSLLAFESAIALGSDLLEFEVHLTAGGSVAVIHDATLDRTTDGRGAVASMTADDLRRVHLKGPGGAATAEHVPLLTEVLETAAAST